MKITLTASDLRYINLALVARSAKGLPESESCDEVRKKLIRIRDSNDEFPTLVQLSVIGQPK